MKLLLTFLAITSFYFSTQAQDLTGTWEGKQQLNGKTYDYSLYLSKSNNNLYTGVVLLKESTVQITGGPLDKTIKIDPHINPFEKRPSATIGILGNLNNNVIKYSGLSTIETAGKVGNVQIPSTSLTYTPNGKDQLIAADNSQLTLTKKNNSIPSEYSKYSVNQIVSLSDINYTNGNGQNKIAFSDIGRLSLTFTNNSSFDIQGLNVIVRIQEQNSSVQGGGNLGSMALLKQQTIKRAINLSSGFDVPADSIHLTIQGTYNSLPLFSQTLALATTPFYLTNKTEISKTSAQTLNALQGYYGFNKAPYASVQTSLTQFASTGNKLAPMWQAVFQTMGWGGFSPDESAGLQIAKKSYNDVITSARNGDAEAQYLMFYAVAMGLTGNPSRNAAGVFLKKSADAGFLPAMYDYALYLQKDHKYDESYAALLKCYDLGMQKAALNIGYFNQKGYTSKNVKNAIEWYHKGELFGDPKAMMQLANLYSSGLDAQVDHPKAVAYATKAADLKDGEAMDFLAKVYLNGRNGVPKNVVKALTLYKEAANLGDNTAMASLASLYLTGSPEASIIKDDKAALFWTKKSAESGGADCMALLANMYEEGKIIDKNEIKARFWKNQALLNGVGEKDNSAQKVRDNEMSNFINNIDMSDQHTLYRDYYGNTYVSNDGPDLVGGIFGSFMKTYLNRQHQEVINGPEYIYDTNGKKIYGGTLTSRLTTEIYLKKGQTITVNAYGTVNVGTMAGVSGPDGISGWESYCVDPSILHGSVMAGMNGKWTHMGSANTFTASTDGPLQLAINDTDYTNNIGYFDVVIKVDAN